MWTRGPPCGRRRSGLASPALSPSRRQLCTASPARSELRAESPRAPLPGCGRAGRAAKVQAAPAQLELQAALSRTPSPSHDHERAGSPPSPPPAPRQAKPSPLMAAILANSEEEVQQVLDDDPDASWLPFLDHAVQPPLCYAAECGCGTAIVRVLLEQRADAGGVDVHGRTPLHILSAMSSWADPQFALPARMALHCALDPWHVPPVRAQGQACDVAVARLLLQAAADPNCPDNSGDTPLSLASDSANVALVHLFHHHLAEGEDWA